MKRNVLVTVALFLCVLLVACSEIGFDKKTHSINDQEVIGIKISSLPETREYALSGKDADVIYNYLENLETEYYAENNDLNGITYVIEIKYSNGEEKTVYHSSYLLGTSDGWYKIKNYKEQEFEKLLKKFNEQVGN